MPDKLAHMGPRKVVSGLRARNDLGQGRGQGQGQETAMRCVFTIARAARIFFFNKKNVNEKFRSARGDFHLLTFFASAMGRCFCMARCFSNGSASSRQRHVLRSACLLPSTVVCMHSTHCTENYGMCKRWEFSFPSFFPPLSLSGQEQKFGNNSA